MIRTFLLTLVFLAADAAFAQPESRPMYLGVSQSASMQSFVSDFDLSTHEGGRVLVAPTSFWRVAASTVLGTAAGLAIGLAVGAVVNSDTDESWLGVSDEMIVGAVAGSTIGAPVSAYLSNRRHGIVYLALAGTGLTTLGAVLLAETRPLIAALFPLVQVGVSVAIVRLTD